MAERFIGWVFVPYKFALTIILTKNKKLNEKIDPGKNEIAKICLEPMDKRKSMEYNIYLKEIKGTTLVII